MLFGSAQSPQGISVVDPEGIAPVIALASADDLAELREWLAGLDEQAYGAVFVEGAEGPSAEWDMAVPDRVSITWLRPGARPGNALSAAADAWFAEWLWVDAGDQRSLQLFTTERVNDTLAAYLHRLECRLQKRWPGCSSEACPKLRAAE